MAGTTVFKSLANDAVSAIVTAPSPATSGLSFTVTAGQGARFPSSGQFRVTVCASGATPDPTNSELLLIDSRSTDTFTVNASGRGYEGSTARTIVTGDVIFLATTKGDWTDVQGAIGNLETPLLGNTNAVVSGTTYTTVLADANTYIDCTSGSATTITIPANGTVAYPVGTTIVVTQKGAGQVTVAVTTDTLNYYSPSSAGSCQTAGQYAGVTLRKVTSTAWIAYGAK